MMKKIRTGDVGSARNSTHKSFEELEEEVARLTSDKSEARELLKQRIIPGVVARLLEDARNDRMLMTNNKNKEKGVLSRNKCNNNEEKGVVQLKKQPKQIMQQNLTIIEREEKEEEKEKEEEDDDESLKAQCVPPKRRLTFNKQVKLPGTVKRRKSTNNNKNKPKAFINSRKKRFPDVGIDPPPPLPDKLKKHIEENGGSDIKLVIMKRIFEADLIRRNNRISIPKNQMRDDSILTEEEKEFIKHENEKTENGSTSKRESSCGRDSDNNDDSNNNTKKKKTDLDYPGLVVKLIEPSMKENEQYLKTYDTNSLAYVLTDGWNSVVERHKDVLRIGTIVQLWSFRRRPLNPEEQSNRFFIQKKTPLMNTNLSFVLVIVDGKGNNDDGASTSECGESKSPSPDGCTVSEGANSLILN